MLHVRGYMIKGIVIHGKKFGRELGFPTANLDVSPMDVELEDGIYAANVWYNGQHYYGALVFTSDPFSVEIHLLDFDEDIYGKELEVEPLERVSVFYPILDVEELKRKIAGDVDRIRLFFSTRL